MQYFILTPAVYAQLGKGTAFMPDSREVVKPELVMEELPKDDIMSAGGGYTFVSRKLARELLKSDLSGFQLNPVCMHMSPQFSVLTPDWDGNLPEYEWLRVNGEQLKSDFGHHLNYLCISEKALVLLSAFKMQSCDVIRVEDFPKTWEERKRRLFENARQKLEGIEPKTFPPSGTG